MTTTGNHYVAMFVLKQFFVLIFDNGRADSRFFDGSKTELFQCLLHRPDTHTLVVGNETGRKAYVHGRTRLYKHARFFQFAADLLGVLRTYYETLTAQNALVADNVRLVCRKAYALDGTVAYTLVTVFAIGLFKGQTILHAFLL